MVTRMDKAIFKKFDFSPFIKAFQKAASFNLFDHNSGNISWRIDDKHIALSANESDFLDLTIDQVAVCTINDGICINNKKLPFETTFLLGIMQNRPDINVGLYFQSPYATSVAFGDPSIYNFNVIPEIPTYIGEIAIIECLSPDSIEAVEATIEKMKNHNLLIMKNHALVTIGKDFNDAIQKAVFFELACFILLTQPNPKCIPDSSVEFLKKLNSV